jgi:hypothetical protein
MFGNGATFIIGGSTLSEFTNISSPGYTSDDLDTTTHSSTDYFKTYIKGLMDAGEIPFSGYGNNADIDILEPLAATRTLQSITITIPTTPSATKFEVDGYVKAFKCEAPHDGLIPYEGTIKVSGKPIYTKV